MNVIAANKGDSDRMTLLLLDLYEQHAHQFKDPSMKKVKIWRAIAQAMVERGYDSTGQKIEKTFCNLRATYHKNLLKKANPVPEQLHGSSSKECMNCSGTPPHPTSNM